MTHRHASPLLSAILIVKNEERNLPRCLASLRGVVDEVVIVDTGSTDRTVEIARKAKAVLGFFPWNGNEADARNASIRLATGRWLFMIDADEEVSAELAQELPTVVARLGTQSDYHSLSVLLRNHHLGGETSLTPLIRIGRNRRDYKFSGTIHATCNYHLKTWPLVAGLEHYGYQWTDEQRQRKAAHMIEHLAPLCLGDKPPLKSLCELMSYLCLAGDEPEFERRWNQALSYSRAERTEGPDATYWYDCLSNLLQYFAAQFDWKSGRGISEETVEARPNHVAANFYLLQEAVKNEAWPRAEDLATRLIDYDPATLGPGNVIYPERQLMPASGWLWLARIQQEKISRSHLPEDLESARFTPNILMVQRESGQPLASANPALKQVLPIIWSVQKDSVAPEKQQPLLAKLERLQAAQVRGLLPHLLTSLARCALLQKAGQFKSMTDELKALTEIYQGHRWFLKGMQLVTAQQAFALECFAQPVVHLT